MRESTLAWDGYQNGVAISFGQPVHAKAAARDSNKNSKSVSDDILSSTPIALGKDMIMYRMSLRRFDVVARKLQTQKRLQCSEPWLTDLI